MNTSLIKTAIVLLGFGSTALAAPYVPALGLVGAWSGDGNANDASSYANHGSFNGPYVAGAFGQAFQVSAGQYVSIPDIAAYDFSATPGFTVSFWFAGYAGQAQAAFLGQDEGPFTRPKWFIYMNNDGGPSPFLFHSNGPSFGVVSSDAVTLDSAWHNVAMVKDGSQFSFYLGGVTIGGGAFGGAFPNPGSPFTIGFAENAGSFYYTGAIDQVLLYNRALGADEVRGIAQTSSATVPDSGTSAGLLLISLALCGVVRGRRRGGEAGVVAQVAFRLVSSRNLAQLGGRARHPCLTLPSTSA